MHEILGHLYAHIGLTGPGEPPEDGEIIVMTQATSLLSKKRVCAYFASKWILPFDFAEQINAGMKVTYYVLIILFSGRLAQMGWVRLEIVPANTLH